MAAVILTPVQKASKLLVMDINNFTATKLKELITVAVTSMVLGLVFAFVMCISNEAELDEYFSYMLLGGLSGFFISLGVVLFDAL